MTTTTCILTLPSHRVIPSHRHLTLTSHPHITPSHHTHSSYTRSSPHHTLSSHPSRPIPSRPTPSHCIGTVPSSLGTHHAHHDFGSGFTVINDLAVAARRATKVQGLGSVLIFGTQETHSHTHTYTHSHTHIIVHHKIPSHHITPSLLITPPHHITPPHDTSSPHDLIRSGRASRRWHSLHLRIRSTGQQHTRSTHFSNTSCEDTLLTHPVN